MTCVPVHLRQSLIQVSPNNDIQEISRELADSLHTWEMRNQRKKKKDQIKVTSFDYVIIGNGTQSQDYSHCMSELFPPVDLSAKESQDKIDPDPASTSNSTDDPDPADTSLLVDETDPDHTSPSKHTKPTSKPDHDPAASPFKSTQQSESTSPAKKDQVNQGQGMDAVGEVSHHVRMDELRTQSFHDLNEECLPKLPLPVPVFPVEEMVEPSGQELEEPSQSDHMSMKKKKKSPNRETKSASKHKSTKKRKTSSKSNNTFDVFGNHIDCSEFDKFFDESKVDPSMYPWVERRHVRKG